MLTRPHSRRNTENTAEAAINSNAPYRNRSGLDAGKWQEKTYMQDSLLVIDTDVFCSEGAFGHFYAKMPPERQKKIDAFRFDRDKRLSLGAGVLLGSVAAQTGAGNVLAGENDKPYFEDNSVQFNLSHSGHYAVCAVSDKPVGVDIEMVRDFREPLVRHVFDSGEQAFAQGSDERFTQLWTIKESVMKFFGQGVALSPKKISISFAPGVIVSTQGHDSEMLRFCVFAGQDFALTVCSQKKDFCSGIRQVCVSKDLQLRTSAFDGAQRLY